MAQTDITSTQQGQYVQVNGLNMYYEEYCNGQQDGAVEKTKPLPRGLFALGNHPTIALSVAWATARCH